MQAQTLARPGWAGSGMTSSTWWRHAVIYRADPRGFGGLHGLAVHMDSIHSIGVDAVMLTGLGEDAAQALDPAAGTMDDLDEVVRRSSESNVRVMIELGHGADAAARARLWLAHGAAGFYVPGANAVEIAEIRRIAGSFAGQRVVMGDVEMAASARGAEAPQLIADGRAGTQEKLTAAAVRAGLEGVQSMEDGGGPVPVLFSDGPSLKRSMSRYGDGTHDVEIAKAVAAMLMTTRAGAMLFYGQELGLTDGVKEISFAAAKKGEAPAAGSVAAGEASSQSLLNWYRQLSALTHSNRTISSGAMTMLDHDDQNVLAWVRRPQAASLATPAIVVVENLSGQPVTVSLKEDMQRLHLKGSFLRTVLRSDSGMGAMHLEGMTLAPYQVFIGELRY